MRDGDRQLSFFSGNFTAPAVPAFRPPTVDGADRNVKRAAELRSQDALFGRTTYFAGPTQARYSSYPGTGVDPQGIWNLQLMRNYGYPQLWTELVEQTLERDGHLGGVADTRRLAVADKDFRLHPARRDDELAVLVQKACERWVFGELDDFDQTVEDLLAAAPYGWAVSEHVWTWGTLRVPTSPARSVTLRCKFPRQIDWVHQKHVRFDRYTDEPYLWLGGGGDYSLPPHKFVFHRGPGSGLYERRGYMTSCTWLAAAKRWNERDWLTYAKIFGLPQILAQYPNGVEEYELHRSKYVQILKDWGEAIPAIIPDDLKVTISREAAGRANDVHGAIVGWANQEISKRVLGSTLTTEIGGVGSWAAADVHRDAPYMRARNDSKRLCNTLRRDALRAFVEENLYVLAAAFGRHPDDVASCVPRGSFRVEREMSPRDRQAVYEGAVNELGVDVDEEQYRDEFGLDAPRFGGAKLRGRLEQVPSGGAVVKTADAAPGGEPTLAPEEDDGAGGDAQPAARRGGRALPPVRRPALSREARDAMREFAASLPAAMRDEVLAVATAF